MRSPEAQRRIMSSIRSSDTRPELLLRSMLFRLGYRYRLHRKDLPGRPDLVFGRRLKVIFVHGCFWHSHQSASCKLANVPRTNVDYWLPKLERNRDRDRQNMRELAAKGWRALVVWECELQRNPEEQATRVVEFLES